MKEFAKAEARARVETIVQYFKDSPSLKSRIDKAVNIVFEKVPSVIKEKDLSAIFKKIGVVQRDLEVLKK